MNRRHFLQSTGALAFTVPGLQGAGGTAAIVVDPGDAMANSTATVWATRKLETALAARGMDVKRYPAIAKAAPSDLTILVSSAESVAAKEVLDSVSLKLPQTAESLAIASGKSAGRAVALACGRDVRGITYGLLELADQAEHASNPVAVIAKRKPVSEGPANQIRSVTRLFVSDVEDKAWFNDREMWPKYLDMLASQRFNRFHLSLGIGYDFLRQVTDAYFLFAYPFLLDVPGFKVRASGLPDPERDRNLSMLKYISEQTVTRGMQFQLGLWMHGYEWIDSPKPNYKIEGLTPANHAAYCREAVCALLKECPNISGVTFRVHGESGIDEGSYDFWKVVFEGVVKSGRTVEIDMHAKGMDQTMIDLALGTGLPVKISPKYWAEHLGMPYHQADIRQQEVPQPGRQTSKLMNLSAGSRSFLRYGYGDLLREDRKWGVLHRIWPGTQRLLLWGDPVTAAAYARAFPFCGSDGVEIMEPLSFKGRRGSGIAGDRAGYADASLRTRWDWEKYEYSHRLWGRCLYSPDCDPDVWRRHLSSRYREKAAPIEEALSHSSRILPIITTAHGASAGNNTYWPEVYTNQPIVDPERPHPYRDTPTPRSFGNVSPLDPQLFSSVNDFAGELLAGKLSGKYSPIEVASWLEEHAEIAARRLKAFDGTKDVNQRRVAEDVAIQIGIGRFFSAKLRAGVLYGIYERTGDRAALEDALKLYRQARAVWAGFAGRAKQVYVPDITVGEREHLRGHWMDRLPAIDADIADMEKKLQASSAGAASVERSKSAISYALSTPKRQPPIARHAAPDRFRPGQPLNIELSIEKRERPVSARLYYRHVNQAERYQTVEMSERDGALHAVIPGRYTETAFPLAYYFELHDAPDRAWLYPGFNADRTNQPYFVVRQAS